jgi:hypothetical protein
MPQLETQLLSEEQTEGHKAQLKRTRDAYRAKNSDDQSIFEYAWTLTRTEKNEKKVREGIRILKALQFQNPAFGGYAYLAIAQAYLRMGDYQKCRQHAHMLMQAYPQKDPERNSNLRKAIELHRTVRNKTTESGWSVANFVWCAGLVTALGVIAIRQSRSSAAA